MGITGMIHCYSALHAAIKVVLKSFSKNKFIHVLNKKSIIRIRPW